MFFQSWSDFIHMGGYGFYVWLAYGMSFVACTVLALQSMSARKKVLREVLAEQQREIRLQQAQQRAKTAEGEML